MRHQDESTPVPADLPAAGENGPADATAPYLTGLNPVQREAVAALDGPVLVLAGAGTGKTRVLTTRLAHLLFSGRARPGQILAVTFTNKAANEMRERVAGLLGRPVEGWLLGTFHSLSARMLRRHAELVGLKPDFTIIDTDDQIRLVKQLLSAANIDEKKWPARLILSVIDRWKDRALTPDKLSAEDGGDLAGGRAVEIYRQYQDRLKTLNAADFGDLLLHMITVFQAHPDVLAHYHRMLRYLLVDEYQDTNVAQYLWLRLLAQGHKNICCVGDDDQSIYGWRGAEIGNILRFESDFPGARIIRLEQNYRSTGHILAAASGVIAHNQGRLGKTLWTASTTGEKVRVRGVWDAEEEARWIVDEMEALQRAKLPLNQIAVLVRAGFQTREFEERLITVGLPYRVIGGPRFYERREIRDAIAYFRATVQPDDELAFERIVNTPRRGIGASTVQTLNQAARAMGISMPEAATRLLDTDEIPAKARKSLRALLDQMSGWRAALQQGEDDPATLVTVAQRILDESGYSEMWQKDKAADAPGRLENLKELIEAMKEFETMAGFLEHVGLVMETNQNAEQDAVTLMTLHGAKGLEFDHVFLPGWEEGVFPNQRALDETGVAGLEEERRLAYVGLTRARHRATVTYAANRQIFGQWQSAIASRFIEELPDEHIDHETEMLNAGSEGRYGFGGFSDWGGGTHRGNALFARERARAPAERGPVIEGTALEVPKRSRPDAPYEAGDRVFHDKFGYGTVAGVENEKVAIDFDKAGRKKVMDSFVRPADQAG